MAVEKVLSKDFILNVNTGTDQSPTWTKLGSRKSLTMALAPTTVDLADADTDGWNDDRIVGYALSFTATANRLEDPDSGARDSGQAAFEAVMFETGQDNVLQCQIVTPGGEEWVFHASVTVQAFGGDFKAGADWQVVLSCSGAPTVGQGS